eukprot:COSAG05_NODE_951_length_6466_cov_130.129417_8_plen_124_part_00
MEVVKLLLKRGSNVDAQNRVGNTALSLAVFNGHEAVVGCLMAGGANATLKDDKGQVPKAAFPLPGDTSARVCPSGSVQRLTESPCRVLLRAGGAGICSGRSADVLQAVEADYDTRTAWGCAMP